MIRKFVNDSSYLLVNFKGSEKMKNKDLIKLLKRFPKDADIFNDDGTSSIVGINLYKETSDGEKNILLKFEKNIDKVQNI